jgi:hypothetical protein
MMLLKLVCISIVIKQGLIAHYKVSKEMLRAIIRILKTDLKGGVK